MALAVLSILGPDELAQAIAAQDKRSLTRASGVGPKLAGRIVAELKDKAGAMALAPAAPGDGGRSGVAAALAGPAEEAVSALVNLGYRPADAFGAVARVSSTLQATGTLPTS